MAKHDLGRTMDQMYPSAVDGKQVDHPSVHLPIEMFDKKYSPGDKVNVEFEGTVESSDKQGHRVKLLKGQEAEAKKEESDEESGDTLLGKK